jgi:hypothetical protein
MAKQFIFTKFTDSYSYYTGSHPGRPAAGILLIVRHAEFPNAAKPPGLLWPESASYFLFEVQIKPRREKAVVRNGDTVEKKPLTAVKRVAPRQNGCPRWFDTRPTVLQAKIC